MGISASARNNVHLLAAIKLGCYYPEMPLFDCAVCSICQFAVTLQNKNQVQVQWGGYIFVYE
jgi:hypothetical protein